MCCLNYEHNCCVSINISDWDKSSALDCGPETSNDEKNNAATTATHFIRLIGVLRVFLVRKKVKYIARAQSLNKQPFTLVRIDNYDGGLNIFQSPLNIDKYQDDFKSSPSKRYREF